MIELQYNETKTVVFIKLNRIDKSNALNKTFIDALQKVLVDIKQINTLKVCVLQSNAKHFCVGADIVWMQSSLNLSAEENTQDVALLADLFKELYHLPLITIAVVQGAVFGGGLGLLACCDFILAADNARFCFSEIKLGILPATIAPYVANKLSLQHMRRLILTAELFSAEQALQWGFIDEVVAFDQLNDCADSWINKFLPYAKSVLMEGKQLLDELSPSDEQIYKQSIQRLAYLRQSANGQEGLKAFLEKRSPQWKADV